MKPILLLDNFLTEEECQQLIDHYMINGKGKRAPNRIKGIDNKILLLGEDEPRDYPIVKEVWSRLNDHVDSLGIKLHWMQIYEWFTGSKMNPHRDLASGATVYTSVIFLNDDFEGGENFFEDGSRFAAKTGRVLFYDGVRYSHGVLPVREGKRWTCTAWYKEK